jgi:hypothetical protein
LREKNRPSLDLFHAYRAEMAKQLGRSAEPDPTEQALDFCMQTPAGAWALNFAALRRPSAMGVVGRWVITHLALDGSRVTIAPALPDGGACDLAATADNFFDVLADARLTIQPPQLFDYDHDGEPELIVQLAGHIHEGGDWHRGRVWTFRNGVVALYPPAQDINVRDVQDLDQDGLPDLWTVGPFFAVAEAPGGSYELTGPRLLAHARADGSFVLDDELARATARRICPSPPQRLVVLDRTPQLGSSGPALNQRATTTNVVCARLWGGTPDALRSQIKSECPATDDPNLACDQDSLLKFAQVWTLPLDLRSPAPAADVPRAK